MINFKREITAEQYERAMKNHGIIADCDKPDIFTASELYGYGVYLPQVYIDGGKYICSFNRGDSCD